MSILVLSPDDEAAEALCSALTRAHEANWWARDCARASAVLQKEDVLVMVGDSLLGGASKLLLRTQESAPWIRAYQLEDATAPLEQRLVPAIRKPFDAPELAMLLARDRQLSEADRNRRAAQAHATELALLVEASFEAIIGLTQEGTIVSWNNGAQNIYGYSPGEIIGQNISRLESNPSQARGTLRANAIKSMERRRRHKNGSELLVLLSRSEVTPEFSTELHFAEVSLDITGRRALERELEHSKRLASIGRISASMSHEINNPLAVIRSSAAWVAEIAASRNDPDLTEAAADMEMASERIGAFVQHICGFARRADTQLEEGPLAPTLDIALRMVRPRAANRGVTLRVETHDIACVRAPHDAPRLAQAIINIVANAIDAAADGGGEVAIEVTCIGPEVCIQVDDTGRGIAPEMDGQLFEPFATTKPYGQGTGLGLAITRQILEDHRGVVELSPRPGGGTRAQIRIPGLTARQAEAGE